MLPIIIYKESFSIRDMRCSVCLGEYQPEDKLQQIPARGRAFHMDCMDHWLDTHATCPRCCLSLLAPAKTSNELPNVQEETSRESSVTANSDNTSDQHSSQACGETLAVEYLESRNRDARDLQNSTPKEQGSSQCFDQESDVQDTRNELKSMNIAEESLYQRLA